MGVARLDLTLYEHAELAEWTIGGKGMSDVAEGIFVLIEPATR